MYIVGHLFLTAGRNSTAVKKKNDTEEEGEDRTAYSRGRIAFNEFSFYAEYSYTSYTLRLRLLLETSTVSEKDRLPHPLPPFCAPLKV